MEMLLTVCVGAVGSVIALRRKIPAGALIGAMVAVMIFNVLFGSAYMPQCLKFYTQISTGAYIGAKISRTDALNLRFILKPALLLSAVMLVFTVCVGRMICAISDLSVPTAMFSMAPAGITDMTLACMDFEDGEPSIVALIQTVRIIFVILLLPPIIRRVAEKKGTGQSSESHTETVHKRGRNMWELVVTMAIALCCGAVGKKLGIPGGAIAFSMAGCAAFNIKTDHGYMPLKLRQFIQVFAGSLIGTTVGRGEVRQMIELWDVVILAIVSFIVLDLVAGVIISKTTDMDLISALFSSAPGGLTDMTLIAAELGADGVKVAGMHMIRLVSVIACYPTLIQLIVSGWP